MTELSVGGLTVEESRARAWATAYLHDRSGVSAYPAYDSYKGSGRESRLLGDADLLAPALLNVSQKPVETYYSLQALTPALNEVLAVLPTDVALHEADDDVLATVASLYAVLDEVPKQPQVGMVKLSKVLARKRPSLIPIYDEAVRECYTDCDGAPVPPQDDRSREGYALALLRAARSDLAGQLPAWEDLAALAPADRVEISPPARPRHRRVEGRTGCPERQASGPPRATRSDRCRLTRSAREPHASLAARSQRRETGRVT